MFLSVRLTAGCVRRDWYFQMIHRLDFLVRAVVQQLRLDVSAISVRQSWQPDSAMQRDRIKK